MFRHTNILTPHELDSKTSETEGRFYYRNDEPYASVTTVMSMLSKEGLTEWKEAIGEEAHLDIMLKASLQGTVMHEMIHFYLKNYEMKDIIAEGERVLAEELAKRIADGHPLLKTQDDIDFRWEQATTNAKRMFHMQRLSHLKHIDNIYLLENVLWSDTLKVAGRVDCIAEFDGVLSIVDFKSSVNNKQIRHAMDYCYQLAAYSLMAKEMYDIDIEQIVIIGINTAGTKPFKIIDRADKFYGGFVDLVDAYYNKRGQNV